MRAEVRRQEAFHGPARRGALQGEGRNGHMAATGPGIYIAVPAALGAAASFGLTAALQHRATRRVPTRGALQPRLLYDLIQQPLFVISVAANIAGVGLQIVALRYGPLMMVQPLLVMGLVFAVVIGSALSQQSPDRVLLGGAGCCVAGLAAFLLMARPSGADTRGLSLSAALPLAVGLAGVLAICLWTASRTSAEWRALALALACGVLYGVTAGLIKVVVGQLDQGLFAPFYHWTLYAVCLIGPIGFLLNQNAYQAERVAAPALGVIITIDPLVAIGIGLMWLGEHIHTDPAAIAGEVLALGVMTAGILALAHRAPQIPGGPAGAQPSGAPGDAPGSPTEQASSRPRRQPRTQQ